MARPKSVVNGLSSAGLYRGMYCPPAMQAVFSARQTLQSMLDVEAALASALVRAGVVPARALPAIRRACQADLYDPAALQAAGRLAGNLAIPLVKALTAEVAARSRPAAKYVHWGATSQDIIDTGLVLQMRAGFGLLLADLARLDRVVAALARRHRRSVMAGRTWLQQAAPVTFGLKAAGWLSALRRDRARLRRAAAETAVLQFGGAVGTLAALGPAAPKVASALAAELRLVLPDLSWHGQRDRIVEAASALGILTGNLGKIARDVSLLMQTEIAEVAEPAAAGRGGSSTMPHKRNAVGCAAVLALAQRVPPLVAALMAAMPQEHERGLGGWQAEWPLLPEVFELTAGALAQMTDALDGLEVDAARMRRNLDATDGLIMAEAVALALAGKIGKPAAHHLLETASLEAVRRRQPLQVVLHGMPEVMRHLDAAALRRLFMPANYLGQADRQITRVLKRRG